MLCGVLLLGKWMVAEYEWFQPAFAVVLNQGQADDPSKGSAQQEEYDVSVDDAAETSP